MMGGHGVWLVIAMSRRRRGGGISLGGGVHLYRCLAAFFFLLFFLFFIFFRFSLVRSFVGSFVRSIFLFWCVSYFFSPCFWCYGPYELCVCVFFFFGVC